MARLSGLVNAHLESIGKPYTVSIHFQEGGDPYTTNTNLMLATGGTEFDVIFIANWAADFYSNAANGMLTDLGPFLARYPQIEQILTSDFMNASQVNGRNYALPTNKEKARQIGWLIREDIAESIGMDFDAIEALPYNERLAALEPWFYKAHEEYGLWVFDIFVSSDYQFDRIIEPIIGTRVEPGATTVIAADLEPETVNAVKRINRWFRDGLVNPNLTNESSGDVEFATGQYFAISYQLKPGKDAEATDQLGIPLRQIALNQPEIANSETTGAMLAIPHGSANKNEAFDFISLLYTDAVLLNIIINGEEGVDYEVLSPGVIQRLETGWSYSHGWTMGDQFKNFLTHTEDPDKWNQFIAFNEAGRPLPALGFVVDATGAEMQTWVNGIRAVRDGFGDLFRGYIDDVDGEFARMRAEYEAAGLNELIAAVQEQFDTFLASR
jgi:putative aldouronate transport system substrate-binding protein